jgi:methylmalonyl-CoA mutase cobalamin-binding domain/chain
MAYEDDKAEMVGTLLSGDKDACVALAQKIINQGVGPREFFTDILTPAMVSIGDMFSRLECFIPELMQAAEAAQSISNDVIQPKLRDLQEGQIVKQGKVVIGTVKGDLHDIGKNIVALMLEVNGFDVIDLGVNVDTQIFINRALESGADIIGLSSLLTTSMPYMREVVERRAGFGHNDRFSIIVGGATITKEYCEKIGAEAYAENAFEGVQKCLELMKLRKAAYPTAKVEG